MKKFIPVSRNVINRMPKYLRCLHGLLHSGMERTSSAQIAQLMGTTPSQVRQDFSAFGSFGSQGYGYNIVYLINEIHMILGLQYTHEIAVIGVGSIGRALLEHMDFEEYNYHVSAAFDIDPEIIGTTINGVEVQHINTISDFLNNRNIDICMLTVPKSAAKEVAARLYNLGVPAIWNFTSEELGLNQNGVIVQDVNFLDSLFALTYYLEESYASQRKKAVNS